MCAAVVHRTPTTEAADLAYRGVDSGVLNSAEPGWTAVGVALLVPLAASTGPDAAIKFCRDQSCRA
ncbi:MAG TPA: hypothetical protein VHR39_07775 [Propionibacteriaceae bacterium]|nr:hypothetical protein [Propionibacteriaceae bacterium]